jgi:hypothetical protein
MAPVCQKGTSWASPDQLRQVGLGSAVVEEFARELIQDRAVLRGAEVGALEQFLI